MTGKLNKREVMSHSVSLHLRSADRMQTLGLQPNSVLWFSQVLYPNVFWLKGASADMSPKLLTNVYLLTVHIVNKLSCQCFSLWFSLHFSLPPCKPAVLCLNFLQFLIFSDTILHSFECSGRENACTIQHVSCAFQVA